MVLDHMVNEAFVLIFWAMTTALSRKFRQTALTVSLLQKIVV
jgi:hypothetical protein